MTERKIKVDGCDDGTTVWLDLTDDEYEVIKRLAAATQEESSYGCQPIVVLADEEGV
jgi:hypothetical protein